MYVCEVCLSSPCVCVVCTEHAYACVYMCMGRTEDSHRYRSSGSMRLMPLFVRQVLSLPGALQLG